MHYIDPHIHMLSRTTDDYERMAAAGIIGVVEPAFWQGQPRTQPGTFIDYFDALIGWERFRASQFGISHYCAIAINPKECNDIALAEQVMKILPRYLEKDGVLAVGEIGYDDITDAEERFFAEQLELAKIHGLPAIVHTPHRDKKAGTKRTLAIIREVGINEEMVVVDHLNETSLPLIIETGCWRGHTIYPSTKLTEERVVELLKHYGTDKMLVNSSADWGRSDPLKVPKTGTAMLAAGFSQVETKKVLFDNPINFYAQSGRISPEDMSKPRIDQTRVWEENTVLRGQKPLVE